MSDIGPLPAPRLDVRDLRAVLAIAAAGSTARAAAALHLTQPAVSRALLAAEERIGARLFDRTRRGLVPTAAGAQLVAGAQRVLAELAELERQLRAPAPAPTRIRLVCECYTAYHWLPTALQSMRRHLPALDVALAVEHTQDPVAALEAGTVDVALLTTSRAPRGGDLRDASLFSDEIVLVMAATHPLAERATVTAADLQGVTLLSPPVVPQAARWFVSRAFGKRRPRQRFQFLPLTEAILDVTRAEQGVAVLSYWIAGPHLGRGDLVARRLAVGPLRRDWRIAWRPEVAAAAKELRAALAGRAPVGRLGQS